MPRPALPSALPPRFRAVLSAALLAVVATSGISPARAQSGGGGGDAHQIVLQSAMADADEHARQRNYTYRERVEERHLDPSGAARKVESKEFDITNLYGRPYHRLIARDGRPLPAGEERNETRKLDREMAKRASESEGAKRKWAAEEAKELKEAQDLRREVADAFNFALLGEETISGQPCHVIRAEPRPGFRPRSRQGGILPKLHGRLWISKADRRWVKVEAEMTGPYSIGWFVLRVAKGTQFRIEFERVGSEVWMPSKLWMRGEARLAALKRYRMEVNVAWSDFRKFSSESRLVADAID